MLHMLMHLTPQQALHSGGDLSGMLPFRPAHVRARIIPCVLRMRHHCPSHILESTRCTVAYGLQGSWHTVRVELRDLEVSNPLVWPFRISRARPSRNNNESS